MQIFLTGASGWIGSAITKELIDAGHSVFGLVRSREKAEKFAAQGGRPLIGLINDPEILRQGAENADGIIHTAFGLDHSKIKEIAEEDRNAIIIFGEVFKGSKRPIIVTSGFLQSTGQKTLEDERPPVLATFPRASEQTAFMLAERGVHASVVRNPRSVHGKGEMHGFMPMLAAIARKKGVSAYVESGQNAWPAVHRLDSARVYRLAVERAACNEAYHAVAEESVAFRKIAEAIGRQVGVPTVSLPSEQAVQHFEDLAFWVANDGPVSSTWTRNILSWKPKEFGIESDVEQPNYSELAPA